LGLSQQVLAVVVLVKLVVQLDHQVFLQEGRLMFLVLVLAVGLVMEQMELMVHQVVVVEMVEKESRTV
jgi:hypothetical protein